MIPEDAAIDSNVMDSDFWNNLESEWKSGLSTENDHPWLSDFEQEGGLHDEYQFKEDNPMLSESEPLLEGKRRLEQGKNISLHKIAIFYFTSTFLPYR